MSKIMDTQLTQKISSCSDFDLIYSSPHWKLPTETMYQNLSAIWKLFWYVKVKADVLSGLIVFLTNSIPFQSIINHLISQLF